MLACIFGKTYFNITFQFIISRLWRFWRYVFSEVFFYVFFQELQHWICLASIILASKEFGIIYFFPQISRLSIYIKIDALFGWDGRIFSLWKVVNFWWFSCQMNLEVFLVSGEKVLQHLTFLVSVDSRLIILIDLDDLVDSENHFSRLFPDHINVENISVVPCAINGQTSFMVWFSIIGKSIIMVFLSGRVSDL